MKCLLTDAAIRAAKPLGTARKLWDGGGLYLYVTPKGAKVWRYKFRVAGKEGTFVIGDYPEVTLSKARTEHSKARQLVAQGIHPLRQREIERDRKALEANTTFKAVATDWIARNSGKWSAYYLKQVERSMTVDIYPAVGTLPIRHVSPAHLLKILKAVESRGAEVVAGNIRMWCSAVFRYAISNLLADTDPTLALRGAVTRPKVRHNAPIPAKEIPALLAALRIFRGRRTTTIAVELLLLTFVRTVELRKAEWLEFDFDARLWRIPAARMKMKSEHLVPLSGQVIALLQELKEWTGSRKYLFPNVRTADGCMSATTINRALERMGYRGKLSGHGFRSTASTLLHELGFASEVIERQLAHAERNKVKAAYNQAQYVSERTRLMQRWADYVYSLGAKVIKIKAAA